MKPSLDDLVAKRRRILSKKPAQVLEASEDVIHVSILSFLMTVLPKRASPVWHTPNGGKRNAGTARKMKNLGTRAGFPDLAWLLDGKFYTFEVKPRGRYQSQVQKDWEKTIKNAGGFYAVIHDIDEARAQLIEWGVIGK